MKRYTKIFKEAGRFDTEFYIGKNNKSVETKWKKREAESETPPLKTVSYSPRVDWGGFEQSLSYAKTLDGETLHKTSAEGMVKLSMDRKISYMTIDQFKKHMQDIQGNLQMLSQSGGKYWKS